MLSPRYLEGISDEIVDIYAQLEADILQDMARRIARLGKVTEATKWQAQLLAETGALKKTVNKIIKIYDPAIRKEITAIYNDAMVKNARADNIIFKDALGHGVSDINAQVMLASIQKTRADLSRLTITTAYTTEQQFVQVANAAYMQVVTGAFDYDTAMKKACNQLAQEGVSGVQYRNGKPVRLNIEPAVRMNIITGVNQTASAMTLNNCDELGCDLVETTAHIGARPEHAAWQGEVFSISGTNPKYRPFSVCELGTITGLCGINCRHSYYPYFEGTETHYTQADLDEMEKQTVTYNGQKMTRYEGEEKLREIERNIRHYKRRALTQEAAGIDNTAAREKIGEWQAKARDFTKQTGIERDSAREFIGTKDGKQPRGITPRPEIRQPKATPAIVDPTPIRDARLEKMAAAAKTEADTRKLGEEIIKRTKANGTTPLEELKKIKEFGTGGRPLEMRKGSNHEARSKIEKALSNYPRTAANAILDYFKTSNVAARKQARGYFSAWERTVAISDSATVAPHELAHVLEHLNKWIVEAEAEFYERRTKGEQLQLLSDVTGIGYAPYERTKTDKFLEPYIGKDYGGNAYELLSMGVEHVLYNRYGRMGKDPDYEAFIIGLLMRL